MRCAQMYLLRNVMLGFCSVFGKENEISDIYIIVILITDMYMNSIILLMSNRFMKLNADVVHIVLYGKHCIIIIMCSCFSSVLCVTILS